MSDIARWNWTSAPAFFGAGESAVGRRVGTVAELADTLADAQRHPDRLTVVQAVVPAMDGAAVAGHDGQVARRDAGTALGQHTLGSAGTAQGQNRPGPCAGSRPLSERQPAAVCRWAVSRRTISARLRMRPA